MKKKIICIILISLMGWNLTHAQKFYARVGVGGGISTSASLDLIYKYETDGTSSYLSIVPVGIGNGVNGNLSFGYLFNKYLGVDLTVNGFMGFPTGSDSVSSLLGSSRSEVKIAGDLISFIPGIVITAGLEKVNPYARFGVLIGAFPMLFQRYKMENPTVNPAQSAELTNSFYGGVALGYSATGGCDFSLNKLINLFVELSFSHATWSPNYSEVIEYTVNGEDRLSTLTTYQKKTEYVDKIKFDVNPSLDSPREALRETYPFSTFAVNFGVKFKF